MVRMVLGWNSIVKVAFEMVRYGCVVFRAIGHR